MSRAASCPAITMSFSDTVVSSGGNGPHNPADLSSSMGTCYVRSVDVNNNNITQMDTAINSPRHVCSPNSARDSTLSNASSTESIFCRICHQDDAEERLLHMCQCSGTMGMMHKSCVERWLGVLGKDKCEICGFNFKTERVNRPFYKWLMGTSGQTNRQNLLADCACFLVLTPLACISTWLCISGARYYYHEDDYAPSWETWGLTTLTVFLIMIYMIWCSVTVKYHFHTYYAWREQNQIVRLLTNPLDQKPAPGSHSPHSCYDGNSSNSSGHVLLEVSCTGNSDGNTSVFTVSQPSARLIKGHHPRI